MAGLLVIGFTVAAGLTYLYPDTILPAFSLISPGASSLRDSSLHLARATTNGIIYGIGLVVIISVILKGKKILQN
jgi:hypothetical protein